MATKPVDRTGDIGDPGGAFKNPDQARFLQGMIGNMRRNFDDFIGRTTAVPSVTLLSPGGKSFAVKVDDNGNVTATLIT